MSARVFSASLGLFTSALSKVIGAQVLRDMQLFVSSFDALFGGFGARRSDVRANCRPRIPASWWWRRLSPTPCAKPSYFVQRLESESMPLAGLVLNRVQEVRLPELTASTARAGAERLNGEHHLVAELLKLHADRMETAARQEHLAGSFTGAHPRVPVASVIALADDVTTWRACRPWAICWPGTPPPPENRSDSTLVEHSCTVG